MNSALTAPTTPHDDLDTVTVIGVAVLAYAAANILHEGGGHGLACLLLGGKPLMLSAVHFESEGLGDGAHRWLASAGTIVNLAVGLLSWWALRRGQGRTPGRYFLWLFGTVQLLQASGYLLFSGVGNVGDWAVVTQDAAPAWITRPLLAIAGGLSYYTIVGAAMHRLAPFVAPADEPGDRALAAVQARRLTWIPYVTGAALYLAAGSLNPHGPLLMAMSAAAASLGGTSGLIWATSLPHLQLSLASLGKPAQDWEGTNSPAWLAGALLAAGLFIGVLGPGVTL